MATPSAASPPPTTQSKKQQSEQVGTQKHQVEVAIQEEPLGKETPVDCPLEHKLSTEIKCPAQVTDGILQKEREAQQELQNKDWLLSDKAQRSLWCTENILPVWLRTKTVLGWSSSIQTQTGGGKAGQEQIAAHSFSPTRLNCQKEKEEWILRLIGKSKLYNIRTG